MQIRKLDTAAAREIYETRMVEDFPPDELKPFRSIEQAIRAGLYEPLAFFRDGALAAYAFQVAVPGCRSALLDYFAVLPALRGGGVGTEALRDLAAWYAPRLADLIIECEHPAEAPDPAAARRRIGFYLRAGARATALESRLFGVRYYICALPCGADAPDAELNEDLRTIYRTIVPDPYYRGNVIFYGG